MDETDPDVGAISYAGGEEGPFEDSEAVTGQDIESGNHHKPPNNREALLDNSPYDNSNKQTQKITSPDDQDQKDNSDYNDANKEVTNDQDAQDSANYQDNQDNSDDQDGSCSSDENSNQDTSCSDNFSNAEGEFQATGDNGNDLADREARGLHDQHHRPYPGDLATFPDDQAVDYSAAFPSNRLANNSSPPIAVISSKTDDTEQPPEPGNVSSKGSCRLAKSFAHFPGFSACLANNAELQSESSKTHSLNAIAVLTTDVPQSSSGFKNILQQHGDDSSHEKAASTKDPENEDESLQSAAPSPHDASSIPVSSRNTPPVTRRSEDMSVQNLETTSETSEAMDTEPIPAPLPHYSFRQLRSRSVAVHHNIPTKTRQARGRRRTTSNTNPLNQEGQCQSLPPHSFSVSTANGSDAASIPVNFSGEDLRPQSASPSCLFHPVAPQDCSFDPAPSPHQVVVTSTMDNSTSNLNSGASILSQDSSKPPRNRRSSSADCVASLPAPLTLLVSDVSVQSASSLASTSYNDGPAAAPDAGVTASSSHANNSLPIQEMPPSVQGSGACSKPESSFGRDVLNIVQDDDSRCESSETTDESSLPKRKKRMKLKVTKKRICKYFSDSSDEEDDQTNVQPSTSFETIADQCQPNSASSSHCTNTASVNTASCFQQFGARYDSSSDSSSSDLEMQVDTGAESEANIEPNDIVASNSKTSSSKTGSDQPKDVCEDSSLNPISEDHSNVVNSDNLPAVESEVTVESSSIELVTQNTSLNHERRSSRISVIEEPPVTPNTDSEPASIKHAKSPAECEGKQSRRRFKRTKTRREQHEDAQRATAESGSAEQSALNNVQAASPPTRSGHNQPTDEDSTLDELSNVDPTASSSAQQESVPGTSAVDFTTETDTTAAAAATSSSGERHEQQQQQLMTKDLLLWQRRLVKYEQLIHDSDNITSDTEDSGGYYAQRQVWMGMRDYYRAKIDSVNNDGAAVVAPLVGASSSSTPEVDGSQSAEADNRTEALGETPSTSQTKPNSSSGNHHEQQQPMNKDMLLWQRRMVKYEQLIRDGDHMTSDTEDSSGYYAERQVWVGMRDYYRAKIDSVNNGGAAVAPLDGTGSRSTPEDDCSQSAEVDNRSEPLSESPSNSPTKPKKKKKKKHRSGSSERRRRRHVSAEDQIRQVQLSLVSSTAAASTSSSLLPHQLDSLPLEDEEDDEQYTASTEAKLPLLGECSGSGSRSGRHDVEAGTSGRGADDDDAVIVESDDDDNEGGSSCRKGGSWRDRNWLSLRKRPKHVYRKRRNSNKSGADADVVDLTNEVESDPDDGDVEVLQHDKPVVYLKTESRRRRRRARLCAQEGSSASNAAAAQTIDISNNDATPPPPPVDMNDPNILFGMLLDLPEGHQLPLIPAKEEEEEERAVGGSATDGERAARLCQASGPDLLEAVCMAQDSKHPTGGEGGTQAGGSRDATLAGGSYGTRWGTTSPSTPSSMESTSGGRGYSGVASTSSGSGAHYSGAGGEFGYGAGPSTSSSGGGAGSSGGGKLSEKAMHMEKLWAHLDVPAEDIPQCRLRQSVVDLEVPSNFDYDCTNSPPYPSPFTSGAGGHGPNSGAGSSSGHADRQTFSSSQYGDVGKFEPDSRGARRRSFGYQPGTSINLGGTSSGNSTGAADSSNSSSLNLLPHNNPFRHALRSRNPGYLGESSASNPLPDGPADRLGAGTSQANEVPDDQGSSNSGNVGHNRSEPVPKLHLIRRSKLWESSSTTSSTSASGGTPMFSRSQSTPIHVSSPLDLSSMLPGPSNRRGAFAPPGGLNQDAGSSSFGGPSGGQLIGDPFRSAYEYNPRHPHGLFGRPYLERLDDDVRNAAAVASILPPSSNSAPRNPGNNRQNNYDPPNNNSGRSVSDYFWLPNIHHEDVTSRNGSYTAGSGSGLYNDNARAAAGSSGGNNSHPSGSRSNNNSDVQFLAANLPDSLMDDGTDDDVLPSNLAPHTSSRGSSRPSNPSSSDHRGGGHHQYRSQPAFDEPQPSGSNSSNPFQEQPSTSSGGGGGGGDCNNVEIACPICLDTLTEIKAGPSHLVSTVCGHLFCNGCLEPAVRRTKQCPTCRRKLTKKQYHKVYL